MCSSSGHSKVFATLRMHASRLRRVAGTRPVRVLVVDDEASILTYVDRVLHDVGYRTALAIDGPEALRAVTKYGPFDLLLTDFRMPQMMGDELAGRLRQQHPGLKVLYVTGYSDQLFAAKGTLWEDEALLDKPYSANGLLEAMSLLLWEHTQPEVPLNVSGTRHQDAADAAAGALPRQRCTGVSGF